MSSWIRSAIKPVRQAVQRAAGMERKQVFVVSFSDSDGTGLQLMLGEYITRFFGLDVKDVLALKDYTKQLKNIPRIQFIHDDRPQQKNPGILEKNKALSRHQRVILLARDPQNITWSRSRDVPRDVMYVEYGKLCDDPRETLVDILRYIGMSEIDEQILDKVLKLGELNRIRKMEADTARSSKVPGRMESQPASASLARVVLSGDPADPDAFKTRADKAATWRVISFGSNEPALYSTAARRLREQCASLGIDYYIPVIDFDIGERKHICLYKPAFILEQLRQTPMPTLWLDCDASLVGKPSLPWDDDWDLGFVPNTQGPSAGGLLAKAGFSKKRSSHWVNTVSGFAVTYKPTEAAFHFLEIWKYLCEWPGLSYSGDHQRMCWARKMLELREVNIARHMQGCVVRDIDQSKEHDLRGMHKLKLD